MTDCGTLYSWGDNSNGQLGLGSDRDKIVPSPTKINLFDIVSISCGYAHAICLTADGSVYGWGNNWYRVFGDNNKSFSTPQKISLSKIIWISSGAWHVMFVDENNKFYDTNSNTSDAWLSEIKIEK